MLKLFRRFDAVLLLLGLLTAVYAQAPEQAAETDDVSAPPSMIKSEAEGQQSDGAKAIVRIVREAAESDEASLSEEELEQLDALEPVIMASLENPPWEGPGGIIIPVLGILFSLGLPVMIISIVLYARHRKRKQRNDVIALFLEKDREIPDKLLTHYEIESNKSSLARGLILSGAGIGIALTLGFLAEPVHAALGAIPLFIGIAYLVIWRLEENSNATKSQP